MDINVVNGPLELWWAPVGETMPDVDDTPAGNWAKIGQSGADNYKEDGVVIVPNQTLEPFTPLGQTAPTKVNRTNEDLIVRVTLADMTLAMVRQAFNLATVNSTAAGASTGGYDDISLNRGQDVNTIALLIRGTGNSPLLASANLQFQLYEVYEGASQEMAFVKGEPVGVMLEYHALYNLTASAVGELLEQDAEPTG